MAPPSGRASAAPNREDGAGGETDDALGDAAKEDLGEATPAMGPDHDQVRALTSCDPRNFLVGCPIEHETRRSDPAPPHPREESRELLARVVVSVPVEGLEGPRG